MTADNREPSPLPVEFEDAARGDVVGYDKHVLSARVERAYPPGRPVTFTVAFATEQVPLSGRSIGSKRNAAGSFDVRIRLTNLTRDARLRLESHFGD